MKKRLLFVAAIVAASTTFAQDGLTSKKGEAYLPEADDFALSFDGAPFLTYMGNMASGNPSQNNMWFTSGGGIMGKKFKDANTAYRVGFTFSRPSATNGTIVNLNANTTATSTTAYTDEVKTSGMDFGIMAGIEKRRGNTRIQGIYGAMLGIGIGSDNEDRTYGLAYSQEAVDANAGYGGSRITNMKNGSTFNLDLVGFVGLEWFFAPKFSLGAEYRWGVGMQSTGEGETTTEEWAVPAGAAVGTAASLQTETVKTAKSSRMNIGQIDANAAVMINFHF